MKRYTVDNYDGWCLIESVDSEWVRFEDVTQLRADLATANARVVELESQARIDYISLHTATQLCHEQEEQLTAERARAEAAERMFGKMAKAFGAERTETARWKALAATMERQVSELGIARLQLAAERAETARLRAELKEAEAGWHECKEDFENAKQAVHSVCDERDRWRGWQEYVATRNSLAALQCKIDRAVVILDSDDWPTRRAHLARDVLR